MFVMGLANEACASGCSKPVPADDSPSLLALKTAKKGNRALLNKRQAGEGWFCSTFSSVCSAIAPTSDKKDCKKLDGKKGSMTAACKSAYLGVNPPDESGYNTCLDLRKDMKKSCDGKTKNSQKFTKKNCENVLTSNYECTDFCNIYISSVCPKISGDCKETKKTCNAITENGTKACNQNFVKTPKDNLAKNRQQCKAIVEASVNKCNNAVSKGKVFNQNKCENVLVQNYYCGPDFTPA